MGGTEHELNWWQRITQGARGIYKRVESVVAALCSWIFRLRKVFMVEVGLSR